MMIKIELSYDDAGILLQAILGIKNKPNAEDEIIETFISLGHCDPRELKREKAKFTLVTGNLVSKLGRS